MIEGALVERGPLSSGPLSPVPRSVDPARIAALSPAPWLAARRKVKRRLRSLGRQTLTHSWDILPRGKTATPNCMIYSTARWNDVEPLVREPNSFFARACIIDRLGRKSWKTLPGPMDERTGPHVVGRLDYPAADDEVRGGETTRKAPLIHF
jgi:hypothetical protein